MITRYNRITLIYYPIISLYSRSCLVKRLKRSRAICELLLISRAARFPRTLQRIAAAIERSSLSLSVRVLQNWYKLQQRSGSDAGGGDGSICTTWFESDQVGDWSRKVTRTRCLRCAITHNSGPSFQNSWWPRNRRADAHRQRARGSRKPRGLAGGRVFIATKIDRRLPSTEITNLALSVSIRGYLFFYFFFSRTACSSEMIDHPDTDFDIFRVILIR